MAGFGGEKGSLSDQLAKTKTANRLRLPKLNESGLSMVDVAIHDVKLGLDNLLMKELATHILYNLARRGLIDDVTVCYTPRTELPEELQFAFNSFTFVHPVEVYHDGHTRTGQDYVAYSSIIADVNCETYNTESVYYNGVNRYSMFTYPLNKKAAKAVPESSLPDEVNRVWERLLLNDYPIVSMGIDFGLKHLRYLTERQLGETALKDKAPFFDDPVRFINLRDLYSRVFAEDEQDVITLNSLIDKFGLSPITAHVSSIAIAQIQLFNYLVHTGYKKGLFSTFEQLCELMQRPVLMKYCIGRHKEAEWSQVPYGFLAWLSKQPWILDYQNRDVLFTLKSELKRRKLAKTEKDKLGTGILKEQQ